MFAKACATTQFYSVESTFSTLMSGDAQTIETIYLIFVRITWTVKSSQSLKAFNQFGIKLEKTP